MITADRSPRAIVSLEHIKTTAISSISLPSWYEKADKNKFSEPTVIIYIYIYQTPKDRLWEFWAVPCPCFKTVLSDWCQKEDKPNCVSFAPFLDVSVCTGCVNSFVGVQVCCGKCCQSCLPSTPGPHRIVGHRWILRARGQSPPLVTPPFVCSYFGGEGWPCLRLTLS